MSYSLWAGIRVAEDVEERRKIIVLPEKKVKKKPDIATGKRTAEVKKTQAEILDEQRRKAKKLHGVDGKKKQKKDSKPKKTPKRKAKPKP